MDMVRQWALLYLHAHSLLIPAVEKCRGKRVVELTRFMRGRILVLENVRMARERPATRA